MSASSTIHLREELQRFVDERLQGIGQRLEEVEPCLGFDAERFEAIVDGAVRAECVALRLLDSLDSDAIVPLGRALHRVVDEVAVGAREAVLLQLQGAERVDADAHEALLPALSALVAALVEAGGPGISVTLRAGAEALSIEAETADATALDVPPLAMALCRGLGAEWMRRAERLEIVIPLSALVAG